MAKDRGFKHTVSVESEWVGPGPGDYRIASIRLGTETPGGASDGCLIGITLGDLQALRTEVDRVLTGMAVLADSLIPWHRYALSWGVAQLLGGATLVYFGDPAALVGLEAVVSTATCALVAYLSPDQSEEDFGSAFVATIGGMVGILVVSVAWHAFAA